MSIKPTFQGEVQMRRWSDSSTQGVQVTFALPDANDLEPLKDKVGKRFMAVLVEIGDDELPVMGNPISPRKDTRGPLCREACDLCAMPEFQEWVALDDQAKATEAEAKAWICWACRIESRKELDSDPAAADRFVTQVRLPFMKHRKQMNSPTAAKPH